MSGDKSTRSDIVLEWSWETVLASDETPYEFPNPVTAYMRNRYSGPAVYRWVPFRNEIDDLRECYVGEAKELSRRIESYVHPGPQQRTNIRLIKALLDDRKRAGATIFVQILSWSSFSLNGQRINATELGNAFVRRLVENCLLVHYGRHSYNVINKLPSKLTRSRKSKILPIVDGGARGGEREESPTCRAAILAAIVRLNSPEFSVRQIIDEVRRSARTFSETTIRTHVVSHMCADAPHHHYADLKRRRRGWYTLNTSGPEAEWVVQLCRLHRPPLLPVAWYPPSHIRDNEHLDALVASEDLRTRIAVEVTRCYRGDRTSGEAKIEEELVNRFGEWLQGAATACLGTRGYRITFTVYLPAPFTTLVPRLKDFLGTPQDQQATRAAIELALRHAEQGQHASMIGDPNGGALPEPTLFHRGSQVYVERIVPAEPTDVNCKFEEPAPGGHEDQWQTVIPMSFWVDIQAVIDAIADKRTKLARYRELATTSNAHALWLLLVVDQSSAWDVLAVLGGAENAQLHAALAEPPLFEEVYLLYRGWGPPNGWQLRADELTRATEPTWALRRLWPNP